METCKLCGRKFENAKELWRHSTSIHGVEQGRNPAKDPEVRKKISYSVKKLYEFKPNYGLLSYNRSDKCRERMKSANPMKDEEAKKKMIETLRKRIEEREEWGKWGNQWGDPEYVRKQMKARCVRPNNLEKKMIEILEEHGLSFRYCGDGKVIIGGKCPDFIHKDRKVVLEVLGIFWHLKRKKYLEGSWTRRKEERMLKKHYKKHGYDCICVWEDDLDDPKSFLSQFAS